LFGSLDQAFSIIAFRYVTACKTCGLIVASPLNRQSPD